MKILIIVFGLAFSSAYGGDVLNIPATLDSTINSSLVVKSYFLKCYYLRGWLEITQEEIRFVPSEDLHLVKSLSIRRSDIVREKRKKHAIKIKTVGRIYRFKIR
jgi:hypothetical protein